MYTRVTWQLSLSLPIYITCSCTIVHLPFWKGHKQGLLILYGLICTGYCIILLPCILETLMYSHRKEEMTVDRAVSPCVVLHKLFQGDYTLLLNASLSVN